METKHNAQKDAFGKPLPRGSCPLCGYVFDAASDCYGKDRPKPGDLSLCLSCGAVLVFDDGMIPILPQAGDLEKLDSLTHRQILRAQRAILEMRAKNYPNGLPQR